MNTYARITAIALLSAVPLNAEVIRIYDSFVEPGTTGFTFIKEGTNFGTTWGALITPENPMDGHIAGFRMWSFEFGSYSRADASYRFPENLTGGFRISWKALNQNYYWVDSGKRKVALRGANQSVAEDVINSSSTNYQNLVELYADGTVGGAWNRFEDGTGASSYVTDPGGGEGPDPVPLSPHTFDLVVNASTADNLTYVLHGTERTLHPMRMDLFIDGLLATPPENVNGSPYEDKSGFDDLLGFGTFSFTTATSGHSQTDFVFDQIYIRTGADVNDGSEPAGNPIAVVVAASSPWGNGHYQNDLLGTFWTDGVLPWTHTRSGWVFLAKADPAGYTGYSPVLDQWMYFPAEAPGFVYLYGVGWNYWEASGAFLLF